MENVNSIRNPNFQQNYNQSHDFHNCHYESSRVPISSNFRINSISVIPVNEWTQHSNSYDSYYYHYTSIKNAVSILRDKTIHARMPKVVHLGQGVFFTIHSPVNEDSFLIENNYIYYTGKHSKYLGNVECAFAISRRDISLKKVNNRDGRDVWKKTGDIDLKSTNFKLVSRKDKHLLDNYLKKYDIL